MQPSRLLPLQTDTQFLAKTFDLAQVSRQKGNHPFGALLANDQAVILEAENTVISGADCTEHAEMNLIRAAQKLKLGSFAGVTLYSSTEPCPMCTGALYWLGIRRLVYGLSANRLAELIRSPYRFSCRSVLTYSDSTIEVIGPTMEELATKVHRGFWNN